MQRQRGGLDGPVKAIRDASPQAARHCFTVADQVDQLVGASEADPDRGFMARTMALCSLPRTNPGNRLRKSRGAERRIVVNRADNGECTRPSEGRLSLRQRPGSDGHPDLIM